MLTTHPPSEPVEPVPVPTGAADIDLDLVADDRGGALDPGTAQALRDLLTHDPAAAARYAGYAAALDGLAAVLAGEPAPGIPDPVAIRVAAALERESDLRRDGAATGAADTGVTAAGARTSPAAGGARSTVRRPGRWRRALAGWGGALAGTAAVVGALVAVVHGGSASTTASSAGSAAAAASPAVPRAAAAGTSGSGTATAQASPVRGAQSAAGVRLTAASLPAVVRSMTSAPDVLAHAGPVAGAVQGPSPAVTAGASAPALTPAVGALTRRLAACRPAGVPTSMPVLAATDVTYARAHAVLVVFAGPRPAAGSTPGAGPVTVRAYVIRVCGGKPILSRTVTLQP